MSTAYSRGKQRAELMECAHLSAVVLSIVLPEGGRVDLHDGALHQRLRSDLQACALHVRLHALREVESAR